MALNSNAQQHIPELFQEIMRHDVARPRLEYETVDNLLRVSPDMFRRYRAEFHAWKDRQLELIGAAERALRWNTDKGSTA
jgi:hypothetical protein